MVKLKKGLKGAAKVRENETDDERRMRLQMEALHQDEEERRRQELVRVALRERALREQRYAHLNGIKIHNQWRKIMRMAKVEELRKEIEVLSQNHEREVDRKDAIVQMLDRDLEEAEEQYSMAVRAHMMVLDNLLDLQYQRMKALEHEFALDLRTLEEEFEAERTELMNSHARQKKDMADMLAAMEQEFLDAETDLRQEFEAQREEIKNRNSEDYNVLKIQLEGIIEELERHFEQAHKAYLETTEHRTQAFKQLTRNDAHAARVIEKRMRKLIKLQEALTHWRTKIASNSREWEERNRALRNEKDIMSRHYAHLKSGMDGFRSNQADRLKTLTLSSNAAMDVLQKKLKTAESVLQLAELCRKYETEHEKVLPFFVPPEAAAVYEQEQAQQGAEGGGGKNINSPQKGKASGAAGGQAGSTEAVEGPKYSSGFTTEHGAEVPEWDALNQFFRRVNKGTLDKVAIDKERSRLERENADLRSILKQYLDGISVNDDVMNNPVNPLLVVNNRLQVTLAERNKARQQAMSMRTQQGGAAAGAAAGGPSKAQQLVMVNAVSYMGAQ